MNRLTLMDPPPIPPADPPELPLPPDHPTLGACNVPTVADDGEKPAECDLTGSTSPLGFHFVKRLCLSACLIVLLCGDPHSGAAATLRETVSTASLLREETDFSRLSLHRLWSAHLDSSYDRTGGNKDAQQFISFDGETALLADLQGPGALVRIWSTAVFRTEGHLSSVPTGILKIYIDDNPVPMINMPFGDLFKGNFPPFVAPLTTINGAAYYTYLPIPYARHCRVTVDQPRNELFYQIDSIRFPAETRVRPFALPLTPEDEAALRHAGAAWSLPDPAPLPDVTKLTIAAGATAQLPQMTGPAVIRSLMLAAPEVTDADLRKLVLRAWFDDHQTPDIEAPVADFFGNAYGHKVFASLFLSQNAEGQMAFRLPMPFFSKARFSIENGASSPVAVSIALDVQPGPIPPESLYLRADFTQELTVKGKAHPWAHIEGHAGHFVGVVQTMQSAHTLSFCEGDDQVRVDDEKFATSAKFPTVVAPSNGTGTEDFFNSAWYFSEGIKALPLSACLVRQGFGRIDAFRFFLNDAPVFQQSLDAQIEHGGVNETEGDYYSSVSFWYGNRERLPLVPMPAATSLGFPKVAFQGAPTVIEAESLVPAAVATVGAVRKMAMSGLQNVWSEDAELLWTGLKKGDTLTLPFTPPAEGDYKILLLVSRGPSNGSFSFAVNGTPLTRTIDGYGPEIANVGPDDYGTVTLPEGPSQLTILCTGKNGRSSGADFGLDVIALRPAAKPEAPRK